MFVVPKFAAIPKLQPHPPQVVAIFPLWFFAPLPFPTLPPSPTQTNPTTKFNLAHHTIASICPCRCTCAIARRLLFCAAVISASKAALRPTVNPLQAHLFAKGDRRPVSRPLVVVGEAIHTSRLAPGSPGASRGCLHAAARAPASFFFLDQSRCLFRRTCTASHSQVAFWLLIDRPLTCTPRAIYYAIRNFDDTPLAHPTRHAIETSFFRCAYIRHIPHRIQTGPKLSHLLLHRLGCTVSLLPAFRATADRHSA